MNIRHIALAILVASSAATAQETCELHAVQLLSAGKISELAALFRKPSSGTAAQLKQISSMAGDLTELTVASAPRFTAETIQYGVLSSDLPTSFGFKSFRVNAVSSQLGLVQFHVGVELGTECTLLALYLEVDSKVKVASAL